MRGHAGGLVEVAATGKLPAPAWFNLLWWSLRSFMTFNPGAVEEQTRGAREREEEAAPATSPG
jgi:hypothetical protein